MKKPKTANTNVAKIENPKSYTLIINNLIDDKRLTLKEKAVLITILRHNNGFYFSIRETAHYLGIGARQLREMLSNFKTLGYLETYKNGNKTTYNFKQESKYIVDFKPYLIDQYSQTQLNALFNSDKTPTKYKNLIKKYFDSLSQSEEIYNTTLNEIKSYEMPKDIYKKQLKEETEQQNEIDLIDYLKNFK